MSTRGTFIVRKGNTEKALYIPCDAYPDWTGACVARLIREVDLEAMFDALEEVTDAEDVGLPGDFDPEGIAKAVHKGKKYYYEDNTGFIKDSLFCEYAYVLDLTWNELEFYVGFQTKPQKRNRYGDKPTMKSYSKEEYYPCKKAATFSFAFVRDHNPNEIVDLMEQMEQVKEEDSDVPVVFDVPSGKEEGKQEKQPDRKNADEIAVVSGHLRFSIENISMALGQMDKAVAQGKDLAGDKEKLVGCIHALETQLRRMEELLK